VIEEPLRILEPESKRYAHKEKEDEKEVVI
jgi:hypothetical protein